MSCFSFRGTDADLAGGAGGVLPETASAILVCDTEVATSWNSDGTDYGTKVYAEWVHGLHLDPQQPPDRFALHLYSFFYNPVRRPVSSIRIVPRLEVVDHTTIRLVAINRAYGAAQERDRFGLRENHPAFKAIIQRLPTGSAAPMLSVQPLYSTDGIYE